MENLNQLFNSLKRLTASLGFWWPVVIVPIWQELLFRYIPYRFFYLPTGKFWLVGIISTLFFAAIHWYFGKWFVIYGLIGGIILWWVMVKYGLVAAIILHALVNALDLIFGLRNFLIR